MFAATQLTSLSITSRQLVPKDNDTPLPDRPTIKARLPKGSADVKDIFDHWVAKLEASPNLAIAIRLLDALKRGDLAAAQEIFPSLGLVANSSAKAPNKKVVPPLLSDSNSLKEDQEEEKGDMLADMMNTIGKVTEIDVQVNQRRIKILARKLIEANYTPDDLHKWLESCWQREWPGDKGDKPTLKELQERIGRVRAAPASLEKDYTRGLPEYAQYRPDEEALFPDVEEEQAPPWPPPEWSVPGRIKDKWLATRDQLRAQLNAPTFETWLRPARPVHYVGDLKGGTLFLAVPNQYVQDWLDRYLLESMTRSFDSILNYGKAGAFSIEIILDGSLIAPECLSLNTT